MKVYRIHYSFEIKDTKTGDIIYWDRGTYETDPTNRSAPDGDTIRKRIHQIAEEHCTKKGHEVCYANYFRIEEVKG